MGGGGIIINPTNRTRQGEKKKEAKLSSCDPLVCHATLLPATRLSGNDFMCVISIEKGKGGNKKKPIEKQEFLFCFVYYFSFPSLARCFLFLFCQYKYKHTCSVFSCTYTYLQPVVCYQLHDDEQLLSLKSLISPFIY